MIWRAPFCNTPITCNSLGVRPWLVYTCSPTVTLRQVKGYLYKDRMTDWKFTYGTYQRDLFSLLSYKLDSVLSEVGNACMKREETIWPKIWRFKDFWFFKLLAYALFRFPFELPSTKDGQKKKRKKRREEFDLFGLLDYWSMQCTGLQDNLWHCEPKEGHGDGSSCVRVVSSR